MSNEKNIFVGEIYTLLIKYANNETENKDNCATFTSCRKMLKGKYYLRD